MEQFHVNAGEGSTFNRRQFLGGGLTLGAGVLSTKRAAPGTVLRAASTKPAGSDLGAIEHVVYLMQENRSFDHYFGSYKGVRGFNDHSATSLGAFAQPYPDNTTRQPTGYQLPFHLDTRTGLGECMADLNHSWLPQHLCWNNGAMDSFVQTHTSTQFEGPSYGLLTMGYYTRADIPYHYALADNFTICDNYHCSIMGPTHPNRLMAMSGTVDPAGLHGGPVLTTESGSQPLFSVNWTTVPELLEDVGVSWKTYTPPYQGYVPGHAQDGFGDAILPYFSQYRRPSSPLYKKAFLPTFPNDFAHDVHTGTLPNVSWIIPPNGYDEHPPAPPANGAWFINRVLETLISNEKVWEKTVLFIMYDENDGLFDHVAPPFSPAGFRQCPHRASGVGLQSSHASSFALLQRWLRGLGRLRPHVPDQVPRRAVRDTIAKYLRLEARDGRKLDLRVAHERLQRNTSPPALDYALPHRSSDRAGLHRGGRQRGKRGLGDVSTGDRPDHAHPRARRGETALTIIILTHCLGGDSSAGLLGTPDVAAIH